ncbi:8499_t:CDS:2 [Funneliformis caledonium]|nr:8499_t:CDS:2 [Funneliformis caledonium]
MTITDAIDGKVTCELPIERIHLNRVGSVHGGLLSTLVDIGGSLAICAKGMHATGVSTDLNVSFLNAAKEGDVMSMQDAECVKLGKTLAFTIIDIKSKGNNKLIAQGRHTKYVALAHKDDKNIIKW